IPMIKQSKDYIKEKKKQHFIKAIVWALVIIAIVTIGYFYNKTSASYFTVAAAVLSLPVALHLTRYFAYGKYQDPQHKHSQMLDQMKGSFDVYHGAIIPDSTLTLYIEHIVVTSRNIYFIGKSQEMLAQAKPVLNLRMRNKGMEEAKLHYIYAENGKAIKNATVRIERDACFTSEALEQNTKIIDGMLM
ncbi:MAG: hypothetical protein RR289_06980, partial [Niameybacter sp.]